jgi:membrane fusion protein (multidrug efflux system)
MAYRDEFEQGAKDRPETAREGQSVQASQPVQAAPQAPAPKSKRGLGKKPVILAVLAAVLAFGGYEGFHWWTDGRFMVSTDDAYVQADITILSAKISGYVSSVAITNNQSVKAGDLIAKIDDGDYRLALQSAKDKLATQQSAITRIGRQIESSRASAAQAEAQIVSAQAEA